MTSGQLSQVYVTKRLCIFERVSGSGSNLWSKSKTHVTRRMPYGEATARSPDCPDVRRPR